MKSQDKFSPLFPLLEKYWDKPLSELSNNLQAKVKKVMSRPTSTPDESRVEGFRPKLDDKGDLVRWEAIHADKQESGETPLDWNELTPAQRRNAVEQFEFMNDPKWEKKRRYYGEIENKILITQNEIEHWEGLSDQGKPSEAKLRGERLAKLRLELEALNNKLPKRHTKIKDASVTSPNNNYWKEQARLIADECFDMDTKSNCRDSLKNYSKRVMEDMQKYGIKGPRGIIVNQNTVMREALQGKKWWANKSKRPWGTLGTWGIWEIWEATKSSIPCC